MEGEMFERIRELSKSLGFRILKEPWHLSPDAIIEKDGRKIGIEFKHEIASSTISEGIGQLLFGKVVFELDELWLVFGSSYRLLPISWFRTLEHAGIIPYILDETGLRRIEQKDCEQHDKGYWLKYHMTNSGKL